MPTTEAKKFYQICIYFKIQTVFTSLVLVALNLTHFSHFLDHLANGPFVYSVKTFSFLTFTGGIEMKHWAKTG